MVGLATKEPTKNGVRSIELTSLLRGACASLITRHPGQGLLHMLAATGPGGFFTSLTRRLMAHDGNYIPQGVSNAS